MGFMLSFRPGQPAPGQEVDADRPLPGDDQQTAIIRACGMLAEVEGSHFELQGFGRSPWNVDVEYDMSVILEQVGDLVAALNAKQTLQVELYAQGVESTLHFDPEGDSVRIRCTSQTDWTPNPSSEVVDSAALHDMLGEFVRQVARGLALIDPELKAQAPFDAWSRGQA